MKKIRENRKLIKGVGPLLLGIKKIVNLKLSVYRLHCGLVFSGDSSPLNILFWTVVPQGKDNQIRSIRKLGVKMSRSIANH